MQIRKYMSAFADDMIYKSTSEIPQGISKNQ